MGNELNNLGVTFWTEPQNRMVGKFEVIGVGFSNIDASYTSRAFTEFDLQGSLTSRAYRENEINSKFKLMYKNESYLSASLMATTNAFLDATLSIRPHNQMYGIFDILEPTRIYETLNPEKDSLVRSADNYKYLNYGYATTMGVGYSPSNYDILKSYISFDLSKYDFNYIFEEAKLKLYYAGVLSNTDNIRLLYADRNWEETGVTYANRPLSRKLITTEYTINEIEQYIEFNILDSIRDIINKDVEDFGFIIETDNSSNQDIFFARESNKSPELNLKYFDTRIPSISNSDLNGTVLFIGIGNNDLSATLKIHTDYADDDLNGTMWIHRYDVKENTDLNSYVAFNQPDLTATALFRRVGDSDLSAVLKVYDYKMNEQAGIVRISTPDLNSTFALDIVDYLDSYVVFKQISDINATVNVVITSMLDATLTIRRDEENILFSSVGISTPQISARLVSRAHGDSDLNSFMYIKSDEEKFIPAKIGVNTPEIDAKLITKALGNSDINATVKITISKNNDLDFVTAISTPDLNATLSNDSANVLESIMHVGNPELYSSLILRAYAENDLIATLRPKVIGIDDLDSYIQIINKYQSGAYYYII